MCVFVVVLFWIPWTDVTLILRNMALMIACFLWTICDWARQHVHCPQHQILTVIVGSDIVTLVILISSCSLFAVIQTFLISKTVLMCFVILRWFEASVFPWIIQCSSPSSRYWYWRNSTMAALPAVRPQCQSAVSRLYNYKSSAT